MNAKPLTGMFAVCDPQGVIVHTTVSTDYQGAIEMWFDVERGMNKLANMCRVVRGEPPCCMPSWEGYEAEGYRVIRLTLVPNE